MKRNYVTPIVKKVAFSYEDHVISASSYQTNEFVDPWDAQKCTWGDMQCSVIFNVKARGLDDCSYQGQS